MGVPHVVAGDQLFRIFFHRFLSLWTRSRNSIISNAGGASREPRGRIDRRHGVCLGKETFGTSTGTSTGRATIDLDRYCVSVICEDDIIRSKAYKKITLVY